MSELRTTLERGVGGASPPPDGFERMLRRRDRKRRNQRVTAGTVGLAVFAAAIWVVMTGGPFERDRTTSVPGGAGTGPSVTAPPQVTAAPDTGGFVGLPFEGATPSRPEHGRLVLYLEGGGSVGGPWTAVWVYADGRVIWGDVGGRLPDGAPTEGATGFVEQHLTRAGVEFLQGQVLSTGLFEHDLTLLRGPDEPGFLRVEARNGDRLVRLTWAWHGIAGKDAPAETAEQAIALEGIHALLSDPTSWPASAWQDQDPKTFVPTRYQVWLRLLPDHDAPPRPVGAREVALMPASAAELLRLGTKVGEASYEMTTDETRALAEALDAAGIERWGPSPMGEPVLRFAVEVPDEPRYTLFVFFGPVLPHGEAFFLGPG